jgi:hypothetical protein
MGARFLAAACEVMTSNDLAELLLQIDTLPINKIIELAQYLLGEAVVPQETEKERGAVTRMVTDAFCYLSEKGDQDYATFLLNDQKYWFSGGMSWGDSPTEACDHIWRLNTVRDVIAENRQTRKAPDPFEPIREK